MGQCGPRTIRPSLITLFMSLGLCKSIATCALCCLGFLHSMGLIQQADLMDPAGSEFLHDVSEGRRVISTEVNGDKLNKDEEWLGG